MMLYPVWLVVGVFVLAVVFLAVLVWNAARWDDERATWRAALRQEFPQERPEDWRVGMTR